MLAVYRVGGVDQPLLPLPGQADCPLLRSLASQRLVGGKAWLSGCRAKMGSCWVWGCTAKPGNSLWGWRAAVPKLRLPRPPTVLRFQP